MEPLVRNEIECIIGPQQEIGFHGSKLCQNLEYSLNYFEDQKGEKDSDLIIDKKDVKFIVWKLIYVEYKKV